MRYNILFYKSQLKLISLFSKKPTKDIFLTKLELFIENYVFKDLFFLKKSPFNKTVKIRFNRRLKKELFNIKLKEDKANLNFFRNTNRFVKSPALAVKKQALWFFFRKNFSKKKFKMKRLQKKVTKHSIKLFPRLPYSQQYKVKAPIILSLPYIIISKKIRRYQILSIKPKTPTLGSGYFRFSNFLNSRSMCNKDNQLFNQYDSVSCKRLFLKFTDSYSYLFTKNRTPFISNHLGLLISSKFLFKMTFKKDETFRLKKKMYSFLKVNEYKLHIFNTKKKLLLRRLNNKIKSGNFFKRKLLFSNKLFYNYFKSNLSSQKRQYQLANNYMGVFVIDKIFNKTNAFNSSPNPVSKAKRDVKISRVKFKPGYQRLWRQYRLALAEVIDYRYIYQKQLTRFLVKFYRRITKAYLSFNENQAYKVIIYAKLVPDHLTFNVFLENGFFYINGTPLKNKLLYVYKNDFIQIEISNWYYIFSRWLRNWVNVRHRKFKYLVFKKSRASKYKLMKQWKKRSSHTPRWIRNIVFDFSDIKTFLEVDFFTLSFFIIYDYNFLTYYTPQDIKTVKFSLYKLYNWKYIT